MRLKLKLYKDSASTGQEILYTIEEKTLIISSDIKTTVGTWELKIEDPATIPYKTVSLIVHEKPTITLNIKESYKKTFLVISPSSFGKIPFSYSEGFD